MNTSYHAEYLYRTSVATLKTEQWRRRGWTVKIQTVKSFYIDVLLSGYKAEQQRDKTCMGILKLADKYSADRFENACNKALTFTARPSIKNIQAILSFWSGSTPWKSERTYVFLSVRLHPSNRVLWMEAEVLFTENTVNKLNEMRLVNDGKSIQGSNNRSEHFYAAFWRPIQTVDGSGMDFTQE